MTDEIIGCVFLFVLKTIFKMSYKIEIKEAGLSAEFQLNSVI